MRMKIKSNYSHTIDGLFWFDLPLGLLLAFIFHDIVRNSLFDNLLTFFNSRFSAFRHFDWNKHFKQNWFVVLISILIGAASHLLWDSFTHENGYFVQTIPMLKSTANIMGREVPLLKILQHSSTIIGGLVIAFAIYRLPNDIKTTANFNIKFWTIFAGFTVTIIAIRLLCGLDIREYGNVIVTSISAIMISITLAALLTTKLKKTAYNKRLGKMSADR